MSDTTATTTTSTSTFVSQLATNAEQFQDSASQEEYCSQVREQAAEHFLQDLLASETSVTQFEELALHRSKCGQKTVRLTQWQGRGPTYLDQSLSDLLDLGDLLQRMQDFLDERYGTSTFRVFNHRVRKTRNVALVVSWDQEGFENVDLIIAHNRQKAQQRQERQMSLRNGEELPSDEEDELEPPRRSAPPRRRYDDDRSSGDRAPRRRYDDRNGDRAPRRRYDDSRGERRRGPPREQLQARPSRRRAAVATDNN